NLATARVVGVGDEDVARRIDGHSGRKAQLGGGGGAAVAARSRLAVPVTGEDADRVGPQVDPADLVVEGVGDVQLRPRGIQGDSHRVGQVRCGGVSGA